MIRPTVRPGPSLPGSPQWKDSIWEPRRHLKKTTEIHDHPEMSTLKSGTIYVLKWKISCVFQFFFCDVLGEMHWYVRFFFLRGVINIIFPHENARRKYIHKTTRYLEAHSNTLLLGPTPSATQREATTILGWEWDLLQQILPRCMFPIFWSMAFWGPLYFLPWLLQVVPPTLRLSQISFKRKCQNPFLMRKSQRFMKAENVNKQQAPSSHFQNHLGGDFHGLYHPFFTYSISWTFPVSFFCCEWGSNEFLEIDIMQITPFPQTTVARAATPHSRRISQAKWKVQISSIKRIV